MGDIADSLLDQMMGLSPDHNFDEPAYRKRNAKNAEYDAQLVAAYKSQTKYNNIWLTQSKKVIMFEKMDTQHLYNTIRMLYNHFATTHGLTTYNFTKEYPEMFEKCIHEKKRVIDMLCEMMTELRARETTHRDFNMSVATSLCDRVEFQLEYYEREYARLTNTSPLKLEIGVGKLPPPPPRKIELDSTKGRFIEKAEEPITDDIISVRDVSDDFEVVTKRLDANNVSVSVRAKEKKKIKAQKKISDLIEKVEKSFEEAEVSKESDRPKTRMNYLEITEKELNL